MLPHLGESLSDSPWPTCLAWFGYPAILATCEYEVTFSRGIERTICQEG